VLKLALPPLRLENKLHSRLEMANAVIFHDLSAHLFMNGVHVHICMHVHMCTHIHVYVYTYLHIHIFT